MPQTVLPRRALAARPRLAGILLLGLLIGCVDDPAVQEQQRRIASPSPSPGASASASTAPTSSPSSTPSLLPPPAGVPGASGSYVRTGEPLDLAIAGPGYFVLATQPEPTDLSQLRFSRQGRFSFSFASDTSGLPVVNAGRWRLMTPDGLYVLGYTWSGADGEPLPAEGNGRTLSAFALGGNRSAVNLQVPSATNPNFAPRFTYRGQLWDGERAPLDADGEAAQQFVAIAQFDAPQGLAALPGGTLFAYRDATGLVRAGIAGVRPSAGQAPRPVGEANGLELGALER